jgi:predicted acyltransferase
VLTGHWLHTAQPPAGKIRGLLAAGAGLTLLGVVWDNVLPINKNLWTSSFVVFSAGVSLLTLAVLYVLIQSRVIARAFKPFEIFGVNAILLYAGAYLLQRALFLIRIDDGHGTRVRLRNLIFERVIDPVAGGELGTLLYCTLFLLLCLLLLGVLYRYRIYLKL